MLSPSCPGLSRASTSFFGAEAKDVDGGTGPAMTSLTIIPHPFHHLLDMGDRSCRLDAVAEVEDQPALCVIRQHVVDGAVECCAAGDQRQRIEIALHRNFGLHT